jgi:hypothetical protein
VYLVDFIHKRKEVLKKLIETFSGILILYVYETWFFMLEEENRFGVFEKWVLKVIFGSKIKSNRRLAEGCI